MIFGIKWKLDNKLKTAYGFNLSDFCVDAEELQMTQSTDSSRINNKLLKRPVLFSLTAHVWLLDFTTSQMEDVI